MAADFRVSLEALAAPACTALASASVYSAIAWRGLVVALLPAVRTHRADSQLLLMIPPQFVRRRSAAGINQRRGSCAPNGIMEHFSSSQRC
jgi:hypothetical protein